MKTVSLSVDAYRDSSRTTGRVDCDIAFELLLLLSLNDESSINAAAVSPSRSPSLIGLDEPLSESDILYVVSKNDK